MRAALITFSRERPSLIHLSAHFNYTIIFHNIYYHVEIMSECGLLQYHASVTPTFVQISLERQGKGVKNKQQTKKIPNQEAVRVERCQ